MAAVATPTWQTVLEGTDVATAKLILELQLLDLQAVMVTETKDAYHISDLELACHEAEVELKRSRHDLQLGDDVDPEAVAIEISKKEAHIKRFECVACSNMVGADDAQPVPCTHIYCNDCLVFLFRESMRDTTLYPPRCCRQPIPFDEVRIHLPSQLAVDFAAKREELDDPCPLYCHRQGCAAYIGHSARSETLASCLKCGEWTCLQGGHQHHSGVCPPDEATQQVLAIAEENGWRACPACEDMIEWTIGCNHMTYVL